MYSIYGISAFLIILFISSIVSNGTKTQMGGNVDTVLLQILTSIDSKPEIVLDDFKATDGYFHVDRVIYEFRKNFRHDMEKLYNCYQTRKVLQILENSNENSKESKEISIHLKDVSAWNNRYHSECIDTLNKPKYSVLKAMNKYISEDLSLETNPIKWKFHNISKNNYVIENDKKECLFHHGRVQLRKRSGKNICGFKVLNDLYQGTNQSTSYIWIIDNGIIHPYKDEEKFVSLHNNRLVLSKDSKNRIIAG